MRPRFQWNIGSRSLVLGERTLVMGVLNVTPDSFSDGGRFFSADAAVAHGLALLEEGADILDIGGESTRPGTPTVASRGPALAGAVTADQELARVLPVIEAIRRERPEAVLSIDTYKASVAREAVCAGVDIVNDVSGFTWDGAMTATVADAGCGAILMHSRGLPHEWGTQPAAADIVGLVGEELRVRVADALAHGISRSALVLDPGFGFGKNLDENYPLLARFAEFHALGFPLLAAASRKSFLGHTVAVRLGELGRAKGAQPAAVPPFARDTATLAAMVAAALAGAHIVRVHAVRKAVEALSVADAILRAAEGSRVSL